LVSLLSLCFISPNAVTVLQKATVDIDCDFDSCLPDFNSMTEVRAHFSDVELTDDAY
jgi:hypothetical protein